MSKAPLPRRPPHGSRNAPAAPAGASPLNPYIKSPPPQHAHSLTLVTSVLATQPAWLVVKFIAEALSSRPSYRGWQTRRGQEEGLGGRREVAGGAQSPVSPSASASVAGPGPEARGRVVLVSFVRDYAFWMKEGVRGGIPADVLTDPARVAYLDCVTELFSTSSSSDPHFSPSADDQPPCEPVRVGAAPDPGKQQQQQQQQRYTTLRSPTIASLRSKVLSLIDSQSSPATGAASSTPSVGSKGEGKTKTATATGTALVVLDGLDLFLAMTASAAPSSSSTSDPVLEVLEFIACVRSRTHAVLMTVSSDSALMDDSSLNFDGSSGVGRITGGGGGGGGGAGGGALLAKTHTTLVMLAAHQARWVMQLRGLSTGESRDVSGVIRVTRGGAVDNDNDYDYDHNHDQGQGHDDGSVDDKGRGDHDREGREEEEEEEEFEEQDEGEEEGDSEGGEWLFKVRTEGQGGVAVWRRGEGRVG